MILTAAALAALFCFLSRAVAGEYTLSNGTVHKGTIASGDEDGVIIKLDSGGFSKREPWINFSQESLKEFARDSRFAKHAEPFIDEPIDAPPPRPKKKEIQIREVEGRVERPQGKVSLGSALTAPAGLLILGALFLGNLYAGFEIARYRNRPVALVCAASAVLPVIGPVIFLCLPPVIMVADEGPTPEMQAADLVGNPLAHTGGIPGVQGSGLSLSSQGKAESTGPQLKTYTRNETQFTRKFFEATFPGFFRVVMGEAEKDLVIVIKAARAEYIGKRISRISATDVHLVTLSGAEASVSFGEIASVTIRHKDARA